MKKIEDYIEINEAKRVKKYYHVSDENIDTESMKDFPMFTYDNLKESQALVKNCEDEGRESAIIHVIEPIDDFKVFSVKMTEKTLDPDMLADIVCNPNEKSLRNMVSKIESKINTGDVKYHAIEISDYSQIDYQEDAVSTLFLHPLESIKSIKPL